MSKKQYIHYKLGVVKRRRTFIGVCSLLITGGLALVVIGCLSLLPSGSASADSAQLTYTTLATHPQAAAQPTARGKTIKKLQVFDNKLFAGYGDYDVNTGPIAINPYNLNTNSFDGIVATSPAEEIRNMRIIDGKLYIPTTDPRLAGPGGYVVSGSPWTVNLPTGVNSPYNAVHVFDIASYGGDLWLSGATGSVGVGSTDGQAALWRSADGGATWTVEKSIASATNPSGFERFYWMAVLNGKLYLQARGVTPAAPVMSYDGTTWQDGTTQEIAQSDAWVVTFASKIVTQEGGLSVFDGTTLTNKFSKAVDDLYVGDDGYLYVLFSDHMLVRTNNLSDWQSLGTADSTARSVAEYDNYIYLGTTDSKILKSTSSLAGYTTTATPEACFNYTTSNGEVTVSGYYSNQGNNSSNAACPRDVVVPATLGGNPVTTIGNNAFYGNQLTSLIIPNSVTSIGDYAFLSNQLTSLIIPNSVTFIGVVAFANNQLTSLIIPNSVTYIGGSAFYGNQLTSVTIPDSVITIDGSAFASNKLTSVIVGNSVTTIGTAAFQFNKLTSVIIGNSVTTIASQAFGSNQLTSVTIPDSVTTIGTAAFQNNQLTSVIIGNSVTTIGTAAFYDNQLTSLIIPNSVTYIGGNAFGSNKLTSVTIPDSVTSLGDKAFTYQTPPSSGVTYSSINKNDADYTDDKHFYNHAIFTQIYASPATVSALGLSNSVITEDQAKSGHDFNQDGDTADAVSGYIINPSYAQVNYVDRNSNTIQDPSFVTGYNTSANKPLTGYLVKDNQAGDTSMYYSQGDTAALPSAPSISGYGLFSTLPASLTLANIGANNVSYIYQAISSGSSGGNVPGSSGSSTHTRTSSYRGTNTNTGQDNGTISTEGSGTDNTDTDSGDSGVLADTTNFADTADPGRVDDSANSGTNTKLIGAVAAGVIVVGSVTFAMLRKKTTDPV